MKSIIDNHVGGYPALDKFFHLNIGLSRIKWITFEKPHGISIDDKGWKMEGIAQNGICRLVAHAVNT